MGPGEGGSPPARAAEGFKGSPMELRPCPTASSLAVVPAYLLQPQYQVYSSLSTRFLELPSPE